MWWFFLGLVLLATQYAFAVATRKGVNHILISVHALIITSAIYLCTQIFLSAHFSSNFLWGVPVNIMRTDAGVMKLTSDLLTLETMVMALEKDIVKLRVQAKQLTAQQKYQQYHLFNKLVQIERTTRLNPVLFQRLGPLSNINLPDRSGSVEAVANIAAFEALVKQNVAEGTVLESEGTEALTLMQELRENFIKTRQYRDETIAKITEYNTPPQNDEEPEVQVIEPTLEVEAEVEPQDYTYSSNMSISDRENFLLWSGHKMMSDISAIQEKLAKTTTTLVNKTSLLLYYRNVIRTDEGSALYRVSASNTTVTFVFMSDHVIEAVKPGDSVLRCRLGPLWCKDIGIVKELYTQPQQASHPFTGKQVDGFLVEIQLKDSKTHERIIYIRRQLYD
jgi:hypothetical protein